MSKTHDVSKLDDLITTTIDSIRGYEQAAAHAGAGRFATFFRDMAGERRAVVTELQAESRRLGGNPNEFGSLAGDVHRRWEDLRHAFGGGDRTVLAEVERGEDYLKEEFARTLNDQALAAEPRAVVQRCYDSVLSGHARAHELREGLQAA